MWSERKGRVKNRGKWVSDPSLGDAGVAFVPVSALSLAVLERTRARK